MESTPPMPGQAPRWVRVVQVLVALPVLAFCVSTVPGVRSVPGFHPWVDGWLQGCCYVLVALVVGLRAVMTRTHAVLWRLLAGAVVARAAGFVLTLAWIRRLNPPPYPSVADAFWVLSSILLLVVLVSRVRQFAPRQSLLSLLDALTAAVIAGALTSFALTPAVGRLTAPGTPKGAVTVNLVYPALDVALLVLAATAIVLARSKLTRADAAVVVGVVGFAVVDVGYLIRVADGTWRPGSPLAALSLLATLVISYAAWIPAGRHVPPGPDRDREPSIVPAAVMALICIGVFVLDEFVATPRGVVFLVAVALVIAVGRGLLTLSEDRTYSGRIIGATSAELLRFRALVESSSDFIAMATPEGRVLYLNPGGRRLVGVPAERDVTQMTVAEFLGAEDHAVWTDVRYPAVRRDGVWEGQSRLRHQQTGEAIPVAVSTFVMPGAPGEPTMLATVVRDVRPRLAAEASVRDLAEQRARLLTRLVQAQDDERTRIAGDVHDDSVQALAAVELRLGALQRRMSTSAPELLEPLAVVSDTVAGATSRLRHLLFDLESPARDQALVPALTEAASYVLEDSDLRWQVIGEDASAELPEATRVTAYRIAKEALVNARQHSGGSRVVIEVGTDDGELVLRVCDDGRGLPEGGPHDRPGHLGLAGMRDRAAMAGGRVELRNGELGGAELTLWLPLPGRVGGRGAMPAG